MTLKEAAALKLGDRVRCDLDGAGGVVVEVGYAAVKVRWDDGQYATLDHLLPSAGMAGFVASVSKEVKGV
jgi:hypothetical protein